ncbi:hypothetical protein E0L93_11460 [Rubrobacter taiwanensis]|jgi:hypothetical protein|uniref:Uncharacterized protein n=1 Tax=Rubrobacter taiwanensis TaxID=185139 RepID=A0A4R1BFE2_9ACTN|nr:hypothetical protein [Rubrobacter taiwanensis]TCJ15870.1 hypothetical protein E0L93_11460 [Rubrobacter taiwanensis]
MLSFLALLSGVFVGGGLVYLATSSQRWGRSVAAVLGVLWIILVLGSVLVVAEPVTGFLSLIVSEENLLGSFLGGFMLGVGGVILDKLAEQYLGFSGLSLSEVYRSRKEAGRGVLIVAAIAVGLITAVAVIFGLLAVVVHTVAYFSA